MKPIFTADEKWCLYVNTIHSPPWVDKDEQHKPQPKLGLEAENFPSVTFCNINPYKKSKIQMVPALQALMTVYEESSKGTLT
ncbi:hypothetical protein Y032_0014g2320 [Ancylostoma ceylanicum]|uniref:Uncharacterized protein n=1 Tax=Ancylostoma ceylanicum TaxID=53326 RepID=A0A016VBL2_9BILA|nr:hypothetical protein Y032_0014g2320 [Ancylostoma ceylanicum]